MRRIYWYCLEMPARDNTFMKKTTNQLAEHLHQPPIEVEAAFEELPATLAPAVAVQLRQEGSFPDMSARTTEAILNQEEAVAPLPGLIVYCPEDSAPAQAGRDGEPTAEWGVACGRLAAVWKPDHPGLVWHEALHLLGAEDCYCRGCLASPTCERSNCVMQFVPPANVGSGPPFLCHKNIALIRYWDRA